MNEKIKLVLLIGSGRSGSTLIDRIVSMDDEVFGVGELINFNSSLFKEYCSCGDIVENCSFWSEVISDLRWTEEDFQDFKQLKLQFDYATRGRVFKARDYTGHPDFERYLSKNNSLFKAIGKMNRGRVVFDSSKSPQRALNLSKSDLFDIKIIYLMRDSRGTVWSFKKNFQKNLKAGIQKDMKGKSLLKSVYSWIAVNCRSFSAIQSMKSPALFVKYEEFCEEPKSQINRILRFIFDGDRRETIDLNNPRSVDNHTIAGNRLRMQKNIVVKPDIEWKGNLNIFQKTLVYLLTFPWLFKFRSSIK